MRQRFQFLLKHSRFSRGLLSFKTFHFSHLGVNVILTNLPGENL